MTTFRFAPPIAFISVIGIGASLLVTYVYTSYSPGFSIFWPAVFSPVSKMFALDASAPRETARLICWWIWWGVYWNFHTIEALIMWQKARKSPDRLKWALQALAVGYFSFAAYNRAEEEASTVVKKPSSLLERLRQDSQGQIPPSKKAPKPQTQKAEKFRCNKCVGVSSTGVSKCKGFTGNPFKPTLCKTCNHLELEHTETFEEEAVPEGMSPTLARLKQRQRKAELHKSK